MAASRRLQPCPLRNKRTLPNGVANGPKQLASTRYNHPDELPTPPDTATPSPAANPTDQPENNEQDDRA